MMPTIDESQKCYLSKRSQKQRNLLFMIPFLSHQDQTNKKSMKMKIKIVVASGEEEC